MTWFYWLRNPLIVIWVIVAGVACSETQTEPNGCPPDCPPPPVGLVVSDPVTAASPTSATAGGPSHSAGSAWVSEVVYVSLPVGTAPTGQTATIRRVGAFDSLQTTVRDGGFTPVPLDAKVGDQIDVTISAANQSVVLTLRATVPPRRPPIVVRADPPAGRTDVPLNARIVLVFSEPLDGATLGGSFQLRRSGTTVGSTVQFLDPSLDANQVSVAITPDDPLVAGGSYEVEVGQGVQDREGDALAAPFRVSFTVGQSTTGPPVLIEITPADVVLVIGRSLQATATVRDANGNVLIDQPVTWSTTDHAVSVTPTGLVTAHALGIDTLKARVGGVTGFYAPVYVIENPPASIQVVPTAVTVPVGESVILTATQKDLSGRTLVQHGLTFTSSSLALATTRDLGSGPNPGEWLNEVTGVSPGNGTITVSATYPGSTLNLVVPLTVIPAQPVASVTVMPDNGQMIPGGWVQLAAELRDAAGRLITAPRPTTWTSDDPSVVTVDAQGLVTGVGVGSATMTATSEGLSGSAVVTVNTLSFQTISSGGPTSCGLSTGGAVYCWGLPLDFGAVSALPVWEPTGLTITSVAVGRHACWVTSGGAAYCWGDNPYLGDGFYGARPDPVPVSGGHSFRAVSVHTYYSCGVTTSGAGFCWGINSDGQLGDGSRQHSPVPVPVAGGLTFSEVSTGEHHSCGVTTAGDAYCWGSGAFGQLGDGSFGSYIPVSVAGGHTFRTVSAGARHTCGITTVGDAYCWGTNGHGQLGDGSGSFGSPVPVPVAGGLSFVTISAGESHTCATTSGGAAYCWGYNSDGELGDGTNADSPIPVPVSGGLAFAVLSVTGVFQNYAATCGVTFAGTGYCWGSHFALPSSNVPVKVAGQP